eukprot:7665769-Pyramimonas_sp.AAC.1
MAQGSPSWLKMVPRCPKRPQTAPRVLEMATKPLQAAAEMPKSSFSSSFAPPHHAGPEMAPTRRPGQPPS